MYVHYQTNSPRRRKDSSDLSEFIGEDSRNSDVKAIIATIGNDFPGPKLVKIVAVASTIMKKVCVMC